MAQRLVDPACPPEARKLLPRFSARPVPRTWRPERSCTAPASSTGQTTDAVERNLLAYSQDAMRQLLAVVDVEEPAGRKARGAAGVDRPRTRSGRSAWRRAVWSGGVAQTLADRQTAMATLAQAPNAVLLAATIPTSQTRARLARTLERHWEEGPGPLKSDGREQGDRHRTGDAGRAEEPPPDPSDPGPHRGRAGSAPAVPRRMPPTPL